MKSACIHHDNMDLSDSDREMAEMVRVPSFIFYKGRYEEYTFGSY